MEENYNLTLVLKLKMCPTIIHGSILSTVTRFVTRPLCTTANVKLRQTAHPVHAWNHEGVVHFVKQ